MHGHTQLVPVAALKLLRRPHWTTSCRWQLIKTQCGDKYAVGVQSMVARETNQTRNRPLGGLLQSLIRTVGARPAGDAP
jgi:hypothetical protein